MHLSLALGKVYEDTLDFESSFEFLHAGNRLRKKMLSYHLETDRKLFAQIKTKFADRNDAQPTADWAAN